MALSFFSSACCTKEGCSDITQNISAIHFYNFDEAALSNITIYTFSDASYTIVLDSTKVIISDSNDLDYRYVYSYDILQQHEFHSVKLADNSTYSIDSFEGKRERCNTGFLCRDFYEYLESYKVSGVKQEYYNIRIYK